MYDTVMVITCYVHKGKGFKKISLTINSSSDTLHQFTVVSNQERDANLLKCTFGHSTNQIFEKCSDFLQITVKDRLQFM